MARGFDSKAVSDQQEEAERERETGVQRRAPRSARRRTLELARADVARRLEAAPPAHRASLQAAIDDLDVKLRDLDN